MYLWSTLKRRVCREHTTTNDKLHLTEGERPCSYLSYLHQALSRCFPRGAFGAIGEGTPVIWSTVLVPLCIMYIATTKQIKSQPSAFNRNMLYITGLNPFNENMLGLYSLSGKTSYCKISWRLWVARFVFRLFQSLWNLTGPSAAIIITPNLAAS